MCIQYYVYRVYVYIQTLLQLNTTRFDADSKNKHMFVVESLFNKQDFHAFNLTPYL